MQINLQRLGRGINLALAYFITLYGLFFLVCWHFGLTSLLTFPGCDWLLPYPSALCLFLSGIALLTIYLQPKNYLTNVLGAFICIFGLIGLAQFVFQTDFGLDAFFTRLLLEKPSSFPRFALIGAVNNILAGMAFWLWPQKTHTQFRSSLLLLLSFLLFFSGIIAVLGFILPLNTTFGLREPFPIHCYAAFGQLCIGVALIFARLSIDIQNSIGIIRWLPIVIVLSFVFFTTFLWLGIKANKAVVIEQVMASKLEILQRDLIYHLHASMLFIEYEDFRIENSKGASQEAQQEAKMILDGRKEMKSIFWVGPDNTTRFFYSRNNVASEVYYFPKNIKAQLDSAAKTHQPFIEIYLNEDREYDLFFISPVVIDQTNQGFLVHQYDAAIFFDLALSGAIHQGYGLEIIYKDRKIAYLNKEFISAISPWVSYNQHTYMNLTLAMALYPSPLLLSLEFNDVMGYFILLGGFGTAIILAALSSQIVINRKKFFELENSKKELEKRKFAQTLALHSANVGTWTWDIKTNQITFDSYALCLLGLQSEGDSISYESFKEMIYEKEREVFDLALQNALTDDPSFEASFRIFRADGSFLFLLSKGNVFFDDEKKPEKISGVIWDVTVVKNSENLLIVSEMISKILINASSLSVAVTQIIETLNSYFGWELMAIWHIDPVNGELKCVEAKTCSQKDFPLFKKMLLEEEAVAAKHFLSTYRPILFADISKNFFSTHSQVAKKEGIKGSILFPIFEMDRVTGAIQLFKTSALIGIIDEGLKNLISSIGVEIGQFIQRKAVEGERKRLAAIVTYANEAIFSYDLHGIVLSWNIGSEKIFRWTAEEMVGNSIERIFLNSDEFKKFIDHPQALETQVVKRLRKDGQTILVDNATSPMYDESKKLVGFSNVCLDVTRQTQMAADLHKSEEKFRDFVETTQECIWEMDPSYVFTYVNPYVETLLGYTPQEVVGKCFFDFVPEKERQSVETQIKNDRKYKRGWQQHVIHFRHKNGSVLYLESNSEAFFNEQEVLLGYRGASRDITERRNIEKVKSEFISMINHELRTPLTSISGAIDLLLAAPPEEREKARELLLIAQRNSQRLGVIINDILDTEKMQQGKFTVDIKKVSVADAAREAIKSSLLLAEKHSVKLIESGEFSKSNVKADYTRLVQVFMNLLSNAIKFSHKEGAVYISVVDVDGKVRSSVRDEGRGISVVFKPKVFDKFAQADASDSRVAAGTGLGLSISKTIVEQMGGTIGFESQENVGSTFFFDLPKLSED